MNIVLRKAMAGDAKFLFDLRNEDGVRRASFTSDPISWETHAQWFQKKLASGDSVLYIVEVGSVPIGQVRFDFERDESAEVSIAISEQYRGRGYGAKALVVASKSFLQEFSVIQRIDAYIKPDNAASVKSFGNAGYVLRGNAVMKSLPCVEMVLLRTQLI